MKNCLFIKIVFLVFFVPFFLQGCDARMRNAIAQGIADGNKFTQERYGASGLGLASKGMQTVNQTQNSDSYTVCLKNNTNKNIFFQCFKGGVEVGPYRTGFLDLGTDREITVYAKNQNGYGNVLGSRKLIAGSTWEYSE